MRNRGLVALVITILLVISIFQTLRKNQAGQNPGNPTNSSGMVYLPDKVTKTSSCHMQGSLPDHACTPGAINSAVTQDNLQTTICSQGFAKTVRPPVSFTDNLKQKQMAEYAEPGRFSNYEEDHLIPLELGGNPTSEANLWPEPYKPDPGAREKDRVENFLHQQVCLKKITLAEAQKQIALNWVLIYKSIPNIKNY